MGTFDLSRLSVQLAFDTSRVQHNLSVIERQFDNFSGRMAARGAALSFAVSAPLQLALAGAIKVFAQLEDSAIRTSARIKGATKNTVKEIMELTRSLSASIPLAAKEMEEVVDQISRMGGTVQFAKAATEELSKFAVVMDNMDVREATDSVVKSMKELGLTTGNVGSDVIRAQLVMERMVQVMEATGWQNKEVTEAFQKGGAIANEYGMNIDQLAASFSMLYDAGKEGAEAGTSLNIILRSISDAYAKHKDVFSEAFGEKAVKEWKTADWMTKFEIFYKGMSQKSEDAQKRLAQGMGIGPKQLTHIMPFIERSNIGRNFLSGKMLESGIVDKRFGEISKSALSQLTILWNKFKDIGIVLANLVLPPLLTFTNVIWGVTIAIEKAMKWVTDLPFGLGTIAKFLGKLTVGWILLGLAMAGPVAIGIAALSGFVRIMGIWTGKTIAFISALQPLGSATRKAFAILLTQGPFKTAIFLIQQLSRASQQLFGVMAIGALAHRKFKLADYLANIPLNFRRVLNLASPKTWGGLFNFLSGSLFGKINLGLDSLNRKFLSVAASITTAWGKRGVVGILTEVISGVSGFIGAHGMQRAMKAFGSPAKTMGGLGSAMSVAAPYLLSTLLGVFTTGLIAAAAALAYFAYTTIQKNRELNKISYPSMTRTSEGGYEMKPLTPELIRNLEGETWGSSIFGPRVGAWKYHRNALDKMLKEGAPVEKFRKAVENAYNSGAIYEEDYNALKAFMEQQTQSSGFTGLIKSTGSEDYLGSSKTAKADKLNTFSATTYGTKEEYKARVLGQAALVGATAGLLEQAKQTKENTRQTAKNTALIANKIGGEKPAILVP